jgi:nitrogen regulatory protein P-II 1
MREIKAIIRPERLSAVLSALHTIPELPGVTISTVRGLGRRFPIDAEQPFDEVEMAKLEIVVPAAIAPTVVQAIHLAARTGRVGDGKVFVIPVESALRIRSGEHGVGVL